jgi:hypothetical protein
MTQWARHARRLPRELLVGAARAVAALCLVVEIGVRTGRAELAHSIGTGAPGEAGAARRSDLARVRV